MLKLKKLPPLSSRNGARPSSLLQWHHLCASDNRDYLGSHRTGDMYLSAGFWPESSSPRTGHFPEILHLLIHSFIATLKRQILGTHWGSVVPCPPGTHNLLGKTHRHETSYRKMMQWRFGRLEEVPHKWRYDGRARGFGRQTGGEGTPGRKGAAPQMSK